MDQLRGSIERRTYALSAFDMQASFANIPYAFFYENVSKSNLFMPGSLLKDSLARVLEGFPILLGHLRPKATGQIDVEVDPENLNLPEFIESSCDTITFDDIKSKNFSWDSWPNNVATVGAFAIPAANDGWIRLLNVHTMRLKDNSGLIVFINIPHYALDGAGYFTFIRHWASTMSSMSRNSSASETLASDKLVIDRACIKGYLPAERKPLDELSRSIYTTANLFCDTLAWLSPTMLGRLLSKLGSLSSGEAHLFCLPLSKLDELRKSVQLHLPMGSRISDNDLLVSLLSKTYVQSQPQQELKAGWFTAAPKPETHFTVRFPCDARPRLGMKEKFIGNLLIPTLVHERIDELSKSTTPQTLASAAMQIRKTIGSVDAPLIAEFHEMISSHPSSHLRPLAFVSSHQTTSMVITSQLHFGLYDADFGFGQPAFVSLTRLFAGSYTMAAILPTAPDQEPGVNVLLTSNIVAMGNILKNEFWRKTAELVW